MGAAASRETGNRSNASAPKLPWHPWHLVFRRVGYFVSVGSFVSEIQLEVQSGKVTKIKNGGKKWPGQLAEAGLGTLWTRCPGVPNDTLDLLVHLPSEKECGHFWQPALSVRRVSAAGLGAAPKEQGSLPVSIPPLFFFTGSPGSRNTFFQLFSERYEVKVTLGSYTLKER